MQLLQGDIEDRDFAEPHLFQYIASLRRREQAIEDRRHARAGLARQSLVSGKANGDR